MNNRKIPEKFLFGIDAKRSDDGKEFIGYFDDFYPKEDHVICGNRSILYFKAFSKIVIFNRKGRIVWKWDGKKAKFM